MSALTITAKDRQLATTAWELATSGAEVEFIRFARMVCKKVTLLAGKQAFYRFARWAKKHGVLVQMKENSASFDPAALRALSNRIRLSPAVDTSSDQGARAMTKSNQQAPTASARAITKQDERLTIRQAARMIGVEERVLARWLRREAPPFPYLLVGRVKRVRLVDVVAWIEANTVGGKR